MTSGTPVITKQPPLQLMSILPPQPGTFSRCTSPGEPSFLQVPPVVNDGGVAVLPLVVVGGVAVVPGSPSQRGL